MCIFPPRPAAPPNLDILHHPRSTTSALSCLPSSPAALYLRGVSPDEIKSLRKHLGCTARELAETLGLDQKEVLAWEDGELFPTKRWVSAMRKLESTGPAAIKKKPRGKTKSATGVALLHDPALWALVRKLLAHPELFRQAVQLADKYDDPA